MKQQYRFYGWQASFFAGKTRGYLNFKGLDYIEKSITLFDITRKIPKHTGRRAMPALESNQGEWFCDTPLIMEELEKRHPKPTILASTPVQGFVAELFQNWVDDSWLPVALHSRWSYPENYENVNRQEGGKNLLPFAPKFIRNKISDKVFLQGMSQHLPKMGVVPEQIARLEAWTVNLLDLLEAHFSEHDYLLGGRPTVADFGLLGPMFGHLNRDPWPKREWLDPRPNLQRWVEKMGRGDKALGDLLPNDQIPQTLMPIIRIIFSEFVPLMEKTAQVITETVISKSLNSGDALPRSSAVLESTLMGGVFRRASFSYSVWRMQRIQKILLESSVADKENLKAWLSQSQLTDFSTLDFGYELKRFGLGAALA
jgi:glutathione S-transferase